MRFRSKDHLEKASAKAVRTEVGDASPVKAIENELQRHPEKYDGIVISTFPLQRSRWVALDQPRRIERRFELPVRHVVGHSVTMTREDLINGLNEDLNLELEALLRSVYHAAAGRGMLGHELRELLKKELPSELDHATFLADKIVALGGEVRIGRPLAINKSIRNFCRDCKGTRVAVDSGHTIIMPCLTKNLIGLLRMFFDSAKTLDREV